MESVVILGLFLLLLIAAAAPGLYALYKRMGAGESRLQFWEVLQRRGLEPTDTLAEGGRALGVAIRRCTLCASVDTCEEWLASGRPEGLEGFCPNADYVERLERR